MDKDCSLVESLAVTPAHVSKQILEIREQLLQTYGLMFKNWRKAQLSDPCIGFILNKVETGSKAPAKRTLDQAVDARYLREWDKLFVSQGVFHCKVSINEQEFQQLVLPRVLRQEVFQALHDDLGHQGRDKTTSLLKQRIFWPRMDAFVKESVRACDRCIRRKAVGGKSAELVNITSSSPREIVCLDYLSLERSKGGHENILVITEHFSRYAQAIPTQNQTAKTTARVLFDNFIVHYGFPARIHSDQGKNFESHLIKELCQIARVEKSRKTPYIPWEMARLKDSTRPCLRCWKPFKSTRKVIGSHMFQLLCMPITPPFTTALDFPHTSLCLGGIQGLQLMPFSG